MMRGTELAQNWLPKSYTHKQEKIDSAGHSNIFLYMYICVCHIHHTYACIHKRS